MHLQIVTPTKLPAASINKESCVAYYGVSLSYRVVLLVKDGDADGGHQAVARELVLARLQFLAGGREEEEKEGREEEEKEISVRRHRLRTYSGIVVLLNEWYFFPLYN